MTGQSRRIVVVEDDPSMSRAMGRILRAAGFATETFATAEEALEKDLATADCLVLDVQLPGMSGFELYGQVAWSAGKPPAVFVTAHDAPGLRSLAEVAHDSEYLPKPFSGRMLLDAIGRALGRH